MGVHTQKKYELTLSKSHDKNDVNNDKAKQIIGCHSVDHGDKGSGGLESSTEEKEVKRDQIHGSDGQFVLDFGLTCQSKGNGKNDTETSDEKSASGRAKLKVLHPNFVA